MGHAGESSNVSDMSSDYDYSAAAASAVGAGAAGVVVMSLNRPRSTATQPYNAFAGPYARALPLRSGSCRCEGGGAGGAGHRRHFVYAMYVVSELGVALMRVFAIPT